MDDGAKVGQPAHASLEPSPGLSLPAPATTPVDWWTLELAFGHVVHGHHAYLDRTTGEVVTIHEELPESREVQRRIAGAGDRYLRIEPVSSRDQHRWMARFITTLADAAMRARLNAAISQSGAFKSFKETLQTLPDERDRWFAYRKQMLRVHIERWFEAHGLLPGPVETRSAPALRQTGHTLLEHLPAADLPTAVTFLMHLGARPRR
jgi:hypothetical protein